MTAIRRYKTQKISATFIFLIQIFLFHQNTIMSKRLFSQTTTDDEEGGRGDFTKSAIPLSKKEPELVNGIPVSGEDYLLVVR